MNRVCWLLLALVLVSATGAEARSKKDSRKKAAAVSREAHAPEAQHGAPAAREAHHGDGHGNAHHAAPQWPNPHVGPTTAHPLEQRPIMFHEHGHHVGSYDELGHWITHY